MNIHITHFIVDTVLYLANITWLNSDSPTLWFSRVDTLPLIKEFFQIRASKAYFYVSDFYFENSFTV